MSQRPVAMNLNTFQKPNLFNNACSRHNCAYETV
jgi:hypothetical protein